MAQRLPHQLMLLVLSILTVCYFSRHQVLGIAMYPEGLENVAEERQRESLVDEKNVFKGDDGVMMELFPHPDSTHLRQFNSTSRRKLGDFLSCAFCKCCNAAQTYCRDSNPCCYSINCDVQPFGFCKFSPISCTCQGCGY